MSQMGMKIGELARQAGVGIETVRYYQQRGLLRVPSRPSGAYRNYIADDVDRIVRIRLLRTLGFTLEEIRALLQGETRACLDVREAIERQIRATRCVLQDLRRRLGHLQDALGGVPCEQNRRSCGLACLTGQAGGPAGPQGGAGPDRHEASG
ncbi:MAG: MerR family transcriptional regulator [Castellaniella sp.]|uniref:MerR family transcriptional regulator n=1 Tax=Castellaniella sp. TaxID=1955812 RepID=UPI002A36EC3F|nr:MerR family transcriptional regulator [Castellaniella sp.]MDY0309246.1 MerR family transcriptional regulator [Castellaniella sp.]